MAFDIEHNTFWWPAWGPRPANLDEAIVIARNHVRTAPPLIPICTPGYLPAEPEEAGNPVLSVYQTDIIYGGRDLRDFLRRFRGSEAWQMPRRHEVRTIRFWSELIEWN